MDGDPLIITGVKFTGRELGKGAYTKILSVYYNGVPCAAKRIYPSLLALKLHSRHEAIIVEQMFWRECLLHSKLHHPNIVKMLGVCDCYNPPVLVMELMECNLTQLLENYQNIPMYVKLSILQDVSRAICYLHTLNPPMMHCNLNCNNILLTTSLIAKVSDFGTMKEVSPLSSDRLPTAPAYFFMPPEALQDDPHYGLPLDVFTFGCVVCHVITQQWPRISKTKGHDHVTTKLVTMLYKEETRQDYIDQIIEGSLKQLVITCLDDDQERRPPISVVSERITSIITG